MSLHQHAASLYRHFPEWCRSLVILGGGCLRSYYDGTPIRDIDCFFRSEQAYDVMKNTLIRADGYALHKEHERYCEFRHPDGSILNLVGFVFGTSKEHLDRFDFRCCQFVAWLDEDGGLRTNYNLDAPNDAEDRLLYIQNNNGTERTLRRIQHYIEDYGYSLHPDQTVEQEDAFEDAFNPEIDAHKPWVHPSEYKRATPDVMRRARRRVVALPVQHYAYNGG